MDFQMLNNFMKSGYESERLAEYSQNCSWDGVKLESKEWYFDDIRVCYSEWNYNKPVELNWTYQLQTDLITFMAGLNGLSLCSEMGGSSWELMGRHQHNLYYSNAGEKGEGTLKCKGRQASLFFIQFRPESFLRIAGNANDALNRFVEKVMNRETHFLSATNLPIDAGMQNMIASILQCRYRDGLKKMYLLSKSIEFLVMQAEKCNAGQVEPCRYIKTDYDKERIQFARDYVMENLVTPPSLTELARIAGINEYKLKKGFKETFGTTVFGYIADARLEMARTYLLESGKSVTEISLELGYSSVQHFCGAFKGRFGVSPGRLR